MSKFESLLKEPAVKDILQTLLDKQPDRYEIIDIRSGERRMICFEAVIKGSQNG
jgi:hypothetical protein